MVDSDLVALSANGVLPFDISFVRENVFVIGTRMIPVTRIPMTRNNDGIIIK
jgi:hypothetical protein